MYGICIVVVVESPQTEIISMCIAFDHFRDTFQQNFNNTE